MRSTANILVVEDDPTIGRLLSEIFSIAGAQARVAPTADAAAAHIRESRPALMTLDLNLPGTSGQELLERVRVRPETRGIPVIVITSQLPVSRQVAALAEAVVEKPFDLGELLDAVRRVAPEAISLVA